MNPIQQFQAAMSGAIQPQPNADLVDFTRWRFERTATYNGTEKRLYTQNQADAHVRQKGLTLPRLRTIYNEVIIPGLEEKLRGEQKAVFDNMFKSHGEWTGDLILAQNGELYLGEGVITWDGNHYDPEQMSITPGSVTKHDIGVFALGNYHLLRILAAKDPTITQALYGRFFDELPAPLQNNVYVRLPAEGIVRPVGRNNYDYVASTDCDIRAARGVAQKKMFQKK